MNKLLFISCICFVFMTAEFVGGIVSGSLTILADATHMFADIAGFMINYLSIYIAQWHLNFDNSYGYHRAEILGSIMSVLLIWVLIVILNIEATERIINGVEQFSLMDANIMMVTAIFGLLCNLLNLLALNCFCNPDEAEQEDDILPDSEVSSI